MFPFLLAELSSPGAPTASLIYGLAAITGYLLGSIPFGYFVGRRYGIDIREHGSGNIGATNVLRVLGKKPGRFVFVCDMLKGTLAVVLALQIAQFLIARAVGHGANVHGLIDIRAVDSPEGFRGLRARGGDPSGYRRSDCLHPRTQLPGVAAFSWRQGRGGRRSAFCWD